MLKTADNPERLPIEAFDGFRKALAASRARFYLEVAGGPFDGFKLSGSTKIEATFCNWQRQGMKGAANVHYKGIKAFSETDRSGYLKAISAPTLVLHGQDDQIVLIADAAHKSIKLVKNGTLKTYAGFSHGMLTINQDVLNADILAFIQTV